MSASTVIYMDADSGARTRATPPPSSAARAFQPIPVTRATSTRIIVTGSARSARTWVACSRHAGLHCKAPCYGEGHAVALLARAGARPRRLRRRDVARRSRVLGDVPGPPLAGAAGAAGAAARALLAARGVAGAGSVRHLPPSAARRLDDEPPRAIHGAGRRGPARRDAGERSTLGAELPRLPRAAGRAGAARARDARAEPGVRSRAGGARHSVRRLSRARSREVRPAAPRWLARQHRAARDAAP